MVLELTDVKTSYRGLDCGDFVKRPRLRKVAPMTQFRTLFESSVHNKVPFERKTLILHFILAQKYEANIRTFTLPANSKNQQNDSLRVRKSNRQIGR